jgi:hypothetical protein
MSLKPLSEMTWPDVEWLWPGYLAIGNLAILDGDPGLGKSMVTLDLAARVTTGRAWPDGVDGAAPAAVLLLCSEDPEGVIDRRLQALGADRQRVFLWPRVEEPGLPRLPSEIGRLEETLAQTGARLVVIDPIMAFWDRNVDVNSDAGVRRALQPLALAAEKYRCAILLVRHLNKDAGPRALYRGGASIAFVAACRLAWLVGPDPKMNERCVLAINKNNFGTLSPSLTYALTADGPRVDWQGTAQWSADELVAHRPHPLRRRAREFLRACLADGPRLVNEVEMAARKLQISRNTLRRAKRDLGIQSRRTFDQKVRRDYWHFKDQVVPEEPSDTPALDAWLKEWVKLYPQPAEWDREPESEMD